MVLVLDPEGEYENEYEDEGEARIAAMLHGMGA
jgi:hypothetical protein